MAQLVKKIKVSVQNLQQTVYHPLYLQVLFAGGQKFDNQNDCQWFGDSGYSRVLEISPNTVLTTIRQKSVMISEPRIPKVIRNVESGWVLIFY